MIACVLICCMLLVPSSPFSDNLASEPVGTDLVVVVRDATGQPLAGVTVAVHDLGSGEALVALRTDVMGTAAFDRLPVSAVRVRVTGHLASGVALTLPGADADGIALYLGDDTTQLDLVVEDDGLVRPDPATMLAPDAAGAPLEPVLPTAIRVATPTTAPSTTAGALILLAPTTAAVPPPATPTPSATESGAALWWLLLLLLVLAGILFLLRQLRGTS